MSGIWGLLVSPKSILDSTDSLHCRPKFFDMQRALITNTQFSLAKLFLAWIWLIVAPYSQRGLQSSMCSL